MSWPSNSAVYANSFIGRLRSKTGLNSFDLPTEAQWEYAALAGKQSAYSWGNGPADKTRCAQPAEGKPRAVGSGPPNAWQLYDMTGNVWEWTRDRYHRDYYSFIADQDPRAPDAGQFCAIRGGGWYSGPQQLRVKNRHWFPPENSEVSIGFRCVKEGRKE
jgi:formylglycine-generating enzyme required for sulfatase activity